MPVKKMPLWTLSVLLLLAACGETREAEPVREISEGLGIAVVRHRGTGSALDPADTGFLGYGGVRVYDLKGGRRVLRSFRGGPPYRIGKKEADGRLFFTDSWFFFLPPYLDPREAVTTSYIEWGDRRTDTVQWVLRSFDWLSGRGRGTVMYNGRPVAGAAPFFSVRLD